MVIAFFVPDERTVNIGSALIRPPIPALASGVGQLSA
jgi:hypothetical protein